MKRHIGVTVAALFLVVAAGCGTRPDQLTILTGGTSGIYYPLGVAMSQLYADALANSRVSVQATKASVENLNLLEAGRGEFALALSDSVADAVNGNSEAGFPKPLRKIRSIANAYPNFVQIVARTDSNVRTLADLKGKRISVGAPKSGTEINARAILSAAGLSYGDMAAVEFLPYAESVELLKNRQLDATLQSSGLGMAAFRDLASTVPVTFVAIPPEVVDAVGNPAYQRGVIPAGTYEGQEMEVPTVRIANLFITRADMDAEVIYQVTKSTFENLDALVNAHAAAKDMSLQHATESLPVELHPGAARYYREKGVLP